MMETLDKALPPSPSPSHSMRDASPHDSSSPNPPGNFFLLKLLDKASPSPPSHAIESSPLGFLSYKFPEIRLQIYRLLLVGASRLRKTSDEFIIWHHPDLERAPSKCLPPIDVAILHTSNTINAEVREVFTPRIPSILMSLQAYRSR